MNKFVKHSIFFSLQLISFFVDMIILITLIIFICIKLVFFEIQISPVFCSFAILTYNNLTCTHKHFVKISHTTFLRLTLLTHSLVFKFLIRTILQNFCFLWIPCMPILLISILMFRYIRVKVPVNSFSILSSLISTFQVNTSFPYQNQSDIALVSVHLLNS